MTPECLAIIPKAFPNAMNIKGELPHARSVGGNSGNNAANSRFLINFASKSGLRTSSPTCGWLSKLWVLFGSLL